MLKMLHCIFQHGIPSEAPEPMGVSFHNVGRGPMSTDLEGTLETVQISFDGAYNESPRLLRKEGSIHT